MTSQGNGVEGGGECTEYPLSEWDYGGRLKVSAPLKERYHQNVL